MTNDELLTRIDEDEKFLEQYFGGKFKGQSALREVVELAQQVDAPTMDNQSYLLGWNSAMDAVIEAIKKELE